MTTIGFPCLSATKREAVFVALRSGIKPGWRQLEHSEEENLGLRTARLNLAALFTDWPLENPWAVQMQEGTSAPMLSGLSATLAGMLAATAQVQRDIVRLPWRVVTQLWATGKVDRPRVKLTAVDDEVFGKKLQAFLESSDHFRVFVVPKGNKPEDHLHQLPYGSSVPVIPVMSAIEYLRANANITRLIVTVGPDEIPELLASIFAVDLPVHRRTLVAHDLLDGVQRRALNSVDHHEYVPSAVRLPEAGTSGASAISQRRLSEFDALIAQSESRGDWSSVCRLLQGKAEILHDVAFRATTYERLAAVHEYHLTDYQSAIATHELILSMDPYHLPSIEFMLRTLVRQGADGTLRKLLDTRLIDSNEVPIGELIAVADLAGEKIPSAEVMVRYWEALRIRFTEDVDSARHIDARLAACYQTLAEDAERDGRREAHLDALRGWVRAEPDPAVAASIMLKLYPNPCTDYQDDSLRQYFDEIVAGLGELRLGRRAEDSQRTLAIILDGILNSMSPERRVSALFSFAKGRPLNRAIVTLQAIDRLLPSFQHSSDIANALSQASRISFQLSQYEACLAYTQRALRDSSSLTDAVVHLNIPGPTAEMLMNAARFPALSERAWERLQLSHYLTGFFFESYGGSLFTAAEHYLDAFVLSGGLGFQSDVERVIRLLLSTGKEVEYAPSWQLPSIDGNCQLRMPRLFLDELDRMAIDLAKAETDAKRLELLALLRRAIQRRRPDD